VTQTQYLALLRGINVGGKNIIKMADLKASLEGAGFDDVATYIQSGNVLLSAPSSSEKALAGVIEKALSQAFKYKSRVVVVSHKKLRAAVSKAPRGFGDEPAKYRYDVIFLKEPLKAGTAIKVLDPKPGVDEVHAGTGVIYSSRLEARATSSRLNKIVGSPIYPSITIRNWNTTTKLLALMG
jgi:uncharacterized protein (DUF1697 family)